MKINSISSQINQIKKYQNTSNARRNLASNVISMQGYKQISFGKANANKDQVIFIGAESAPWSKAGGVGTVMQDYRNFGAPENQIEITPYYKAKKNDDNEIIPVTQDNNPNQYIMKTGGKDILLEKVAEKKMEWGKLAGDNSDTIILFKKMPDGENDKACPSYFVFVDDVARMQKPYEGGMQYRSGAKQINNGWNGDPYAKFSKASVEFLPDIIADVNKGRQEKGIAEFNPATIVCSDSQTAFVHEYLAQHAVKDKDNKDSCYYGIHPTYVGHNLGPGYCGETSGRNMFVNLGATKEQIEKIEKDPLYQDVKDSYRENDYFKPFISETIDETGCASAVMIPIHYTKKGVDGENFSKMFTVVAEDYADSLATNPQAAHNIHGHLNQLKAEGSFDGILNPLNDPALDASKKLPNDLYNVDCKEVIDGEEVIYPAFKFYPKNPTYQEMRDVKNYNKLQLLKRFSAEDSTIVTGNKKRTADINPGAPRTRSYQVIKPELIEMIENGKGDEVPVFASWGRSDTQKGHDITVAAFKKFAKTPEGKNAILILGAGLDDSKESSKLKKEFKEMFRDKDLQGRVVLIDGWAPAYALSSAADFAIFASRFEPCGLTDLEAMKYYCTPIVTNTQGLKQKNYDPRIEDEKDKATSFRTQHEYNLLKNQVQPIIDAYAYGKEDQKEEIKKEYPIFQNADGTYDESLFKNFAEKYLNYLKENQIKTDEDKDWDKLSQNYDFKFDGCARELKDGILAAELADSISYAVSKTDKETKEKMYENIKNTNTSWDGNAKLHPTQESSLQRYKNLHMNKEYSVPNEADLLKITNNDLIDENIINKQKGDLTNRIENYLGASLVGGALVALLKNINSKQGGDVLNNELKEAQKTIQELTKDCDSIKSQLTQATKKLKHVNRNMAIVGAVAAVAGGAITYFAAKQINKKNVENQTKVQQQPVQTQTKQPQVTISESKPAESAKSENTNLLQNFISMDDFANGLNKA